ncbi:MAG: CHAD domain-containing protein [Cytophagales bacterium]|nr:CHAD domain-containing protein [Armatimonadota bacterium]
MAKATYEYPADIAFRDAARAAMDSGFRKMMKNASGTRSGAERREATAEEVEALHDMRVGSRRLRAALAVFANVFPKADFQEMDKEVGAITDALGAVRDLDVQLDALRALQSAAPPNEAYGISRLVERQTEQREIERKALLVALERLDKSRFERRFQKALDRALPPGPAAAKAPESDVSEEVTHG